MVNYVLFLCLFFPLPEAEFCKIRMSLEHLCVSEHLPLSDTDPNVTAFSNVTLLCLTRAATLYSRNGTVSF